jgi:hypothetical protein
VNAAWLALCAGIGRPDLGADSGLCDAAGRRACHDEIDRALAAWPPLRSDFLPPVLNSSAEEAQKTAFG